jgi:hypothetical protein
LTTPAGLPAEVADELKVLACRPEGTFAFVYESEDFFNRAGTMRPLDLAAGRHVFRVDRTHDQSLSSFMPALAPERGSFRWI